jgi:hypothetical protein
MQKWEYLVVYLQDSYVAENQKQIDMHLDADKFTEKLNTLGNAGWELVGFEWTNDGTKAALKRPKS